MIIKAGTVVNDLEAVAPYYLDDGHLVWVCRCGRCGQLADVKDEYLRQKKKETCGCHRLWALVGKVFGHWEVIGWKRVDEKDRKTTLSRSLLQVKCSICGKESWKTWDAVRQAHPCFCQTVNAPKEKQRHPSIVDLTGKRFGKLTVIGLNQGHDKHSHNAIWDCVCDCGKTKSLPSNCLTRKKEKVGIRPSCGCTRSPDLTGRKFGMLTVVAPLGSRNGLRIWSCLCDCGNFVCLDSSRVKETKSCGCANGWRDHTGEKHGMLTVVSEVKERGPAGARRWLCLCDCGGSTIVDSGNLERQNSCGCRGNLKRTRYLTPDSSSRG